MVNAQKLFPHQLQLYLREQKEITRVQHTVRDGEGGGGGGGGAFFVTAVSNFLPGGVEWRLLCGHLRCHGGAAGRRCPCFGRHALQGLKTG